MKNVQALQQQVQQQPTIPKQPTVESFFVLCKKNDVVVRQSCYSYGKIGGGKPSYC